MKKILALITIILCITVTLVSCDTKTETTIDAETSETEASTVVNDSAILDEGATTSETSADDVVTEGPATEGTVKVD